MLKKQLAHATIVSNMQNQTVQNSVSGNGLQGSSGLQPQDSTTQKQASTQPQQDVLGVDQYKTFDGVVSGAPAPASQPAAVSHTGLYIVMLLFLVLAAVFAFIKYKRTTQTASLATAVAMPLGQESLSVSPEIAASKPVKKSKKSKAAKPKLKKRTSGSKSKRKK